MQGYHQDCACQGVFVQVVAKILGSQHCAIINCFQFLSDHHLPTPKQLCLANVVNWLLEGGFVR